MSKELFRALDADVERLLVAGGGAAGADDGLRARREGLAKLGEKVPFLAKMAEQAGKVSGAKARAAATELLNLSAMSAQLRGAQATPRPAEGEAGALAKTAQLETPLPPFELEPLFYALTNSQPPGRDRGSVKRNKVIASAVERGAVHDLRLMELWVAALRDNGIGDTIVEEVIPKLGEASVPYVLAAYDPKGAAPDARRLRAVTTVRGPGARELVDQGLENGSLAVKSAALELLGRLDPPAAEAKALALLSDKNQVVRKACVRGLAKATSDAALDALLGALNDTDEVREAAIKVLGKLEHPKTTERLLALLTPEALDVKPYKAPRAAKGATKATAKRTATRRAVAKVSTEERAAMNAIEKKTEYAVAIMEALGPRPLTPATLERLAPVFRQHAIEKLRITAGEALLRSRDPKAMTVVAEELTSDVHELKMLAINAFFRLDPATVAQRAKPFFSEAALKEKPGPDRVELILEELATPNYHLSDYEHFFNDKDKKAEEDEDDDESSDDDESDDQPKKLGPALDGAWVELLLPLLKHPKASKFHELYEALGHTRDPRVVKPLSDVFETGKGHESSIADALIEAAGPAAAPILLKGLGDKRTLDAAATALGELRHGPAVDPLIKLLEKGSTAESTIVYSLSQIGDQRAAPAVLARFDKIKGGAYPGYLLRALRKLDDPSVVPALKAKGEKLKKVKSKAWLANQFEELVNHLERPRAAP
ncbi:MAG: HEAT repeat domain-containing protein [Polyangiaceae bacterium]|nr:HEAT repeat domain-containing protein [Polyangiaceae bacterium]